MRTIRIGALLLIGTALSGCTPALNLFFSSVSALGTGVNVVQEYKARQAQQDQTAAIRDLGLIQKDQTAEIKLLGDEIRKLLQLLEQKGSRP